MRRSIVRSALSCLAAGGVILLAPGSAAAGVALAPVFGDHMVLQQGVPVPVWGTSAPNEAVTVSFAGGTKTARADAKGLWKVMLDPLAASAQGRDLVVAGQSTVTIRDVLVGEVWFCSGQSNMAWPLSKSSGFSNLLSEAGSSATTFRVNGGSSTAWRPAAPSTIRDFSGVAYFFGRELHRELDVPVGLVCRARGGTRIELWTPMAAIEASAWGAQLLHVMRSPAAQKAATDYAATTRVWQAATADWDRRRKAGENAGPAPARPPAPTGWLAGSFMRPDVLGSLYSSLVSPCVPYAIRGAIWYQGESNKEDGMLYRLKLETLIDAWRQAWGQGSFPFLYVQIAPVGSTPGLWQAQLSALAITNTGMSVSTDIGVGGIHPLDKESVGRRLSLWALARTYGRDGVVYSGPLFRSAAADGGAMRVRFDHAAGLKTSGGPAPAAVEVAGTNAVFVAAKAKIDGETLLASNPAVPAPAFVRMGWTPGTLPNLVNAAGLPASPFTSQPLPMRLPGGQTPPKADMPPSTAIVAP